MAPNTVSGERRQTARRRPPRLVYAELGAANGGMIRDLSEEGFAVRAMMPVNAAQTTSFSFMLNEAVRVDGEGEVVWTEDKGRVAGIRFTKISAHARSQIQAWISEDLDVPEADQSDTDIPAPAAQSFDELRNELHSVVPPREPAPTRRVESPGGPHQDRPPTPPMASARAQAETAESTPVIPRKLFPTFPRSLGAPNAAGNGVTSDIPASHEASKASDSSNEVQAPSSTSFPLRTAPAEKKGGHWPTFVGDPVPESGVQDVPSSPLPDISNVLIQPPSKAAEHIPRPPILEPLELPHHGRGERPGFTVARAVLIMSVLALVAAGAVYRQRLGAGFIWVGQQLSGTPSQAQTPDSNEDVPKPDATKSETTKPEATQASPNDQQTQAPSNPTSSSAAETSGRPASAGNDGNATPGATHATSNPQNSVPSIPQGTPPPVTPLSGMSQDRGTDQGQESGAAEYAKAMEMLHAKSGSVDAQEAVRFLWLSVEKGNPNAELQLAELYWRGEGVARNCDQTRILLSAAARKGNPDAQKKLQQFRREGCE
jgi:hypothetical protein